MTPFGGGRRVRGVARNLRGANQGSGTEVPGEVQRQNMEIHREHQRGRDKN